MGIDTKLFVSRKRLLPVSQKRAIHPNTTLSIFPNFPSRLGVGKVGSGWNGRIWLIPRQPAAVAERGPLARAGLGRPWAPPPAGLAAQAGSGVGRRRLRNARCRGLRAPGSAPRRILCGRRTRTPRQRSAARRGASASPPQSPPRGGARPPRRLPRLRPPPPAKVSRSRAGPGGQRPVTKYAGESGGQVGHGRDHPASPGKPAIPSSNKKVPRVCMWQSCT
jgi:hypothetical protein